MTNTTRRALAIAASVALALLLMTFLVTQFVSFGPPTARTTHANAVYPTATLPSATSVPLTPLPTSFVTMTPQATPLPNATQGPGSYPTAVPPTATTHPKPTTTAVPPTATTVPATQGVPTATTVPATVAPPTATPVPTPPPDFVDPLNDFSLMSGYTMATSGDNTANMYFDTSAPQDFGGDTSRLVRKVGYNAATIQYHVSGAHSLTLWDTEADRQQPPGQLYQPLLVQESMDGQTWQTVPYQVSDPVHYPDYWLGFTVTATFDPGTTDIRLGWSDAAVPLYNDPWASQWQGLKVGRI